MKNKTITLKASLLGFKALSFFKTAHMRTYRMRIVILVAVTYGFAPILAHATIFQFDQVRDIFKRRFAKDPLVIMTCELLLKSQLDALAATQDITESVDLGAVANS